ncbi:hypothetical protein, partial [Microbacterium sp. Bi128]|uniref:hypothetical protein n=1 Tax=Microbacterium sp. Bi128 TaxID=2821115 RepID=UPI001E5BA270
MIHIFRCTVFPQDFSAGTVSSSGRRLLSASYLHADRLSVGVKCQCTAWPGTKKFRIHVIRARAARQIRRTHVFDYVCHIPVQTVHRVDEDEVHDPVYHQLTELR